MVELKYPKGWSFGRADNIVSEDKMAFSLDRDLYIKARTYSEGPMNGGIDRFITAMRKGFSIDDILNGLYDGLIDTDPRNKIGDKISGTIIINNPEVSENKIPFQTLEEIASYKNVNIRTVKRWKDTGKIIQDSDGVYILNF